MRRILPDRPLTAAERTKRYREANKEKVKLQIKRYAAENRPRIREIRRRSHHKDPTRRLLNLARRRARLKGIEFSLSRADIVIPKTCPVLGIDIRLSNGGFNDNSPTLDRVDNALGYVPGNVVVVSWRANRIKCDAAIDELRKIVEFYDRWKAGAR